MVKDNELFFQNGPSAAGTKRKGPETFRPGPLITCEDQSNLTAKPTEKGYNSGPLFSWNSGVRL